MMKTTLTLTTLTLALAACGELANPAAPGGTPADQDAPGGDSDPIDPNAPPPAIPVLSSLPARYGYDTIPVRGTAVANETVFVEGGKAPVATDSAADGRFCVDVPLTANVTQVLKVFVQDSRGVTSAPAEATVEQDPDLAETAVPEQPLVDLVADVPAASDSTPEEGVFDNLTDGNAATAVAMPEESTLWFDLGDQYDLATIELVFTDELGAGDDTFAPDYQILVSDEASPTTPPAFEAAGWTLLYNIYGGSGLPWGDGGLERFELSTPVRARYVAFYLIQNNKWAMFSDYIRLSEISVVGRSIEALPPAPQTPTCANGKLP